MNDNLNKYLNLLERAMKSSRNTQTYKTVLKITFIRKKNSTYVKDLLKFALLKQLAAKNNFYILRNRKFHYSSHALFLKSL